MTVAGEDPEIKIVSHDECSYSDPAIAGIRRRLSKQDRMWMRFREPLSPAKALWRPSRTRLRSSPVRPGKPPLISARSQTEPTRYRLGLRELKVAVTVAGGKITEVKIVSHDESPGIADPALIGVPKAIVEKQSVEVDAVTGATFTSQGIMEAVEEALAGAPTK